MSYDEPWGDEVGPGWMPIVRDAHVKLKHLDPGYRVSQIKEKFGGLCYYFSTSPDASDVVRRIMDDVVIAAEFRCGHVCEECGAPGESRPGRWVKTLCDQHAEARS